MESSRRIRYQCAKCTYRTQAKELFERHFARHSTDRPYECTSCNFSVFDHSKFVDHLVHHEKAEVIQCPFCPYKSVAEGMKRHMPKHRAVEFFDCSVCEFSSNHTKSLKRHMDVAHAQVFKCEYCQKRMSKHLLIKHWDEAHGIREIAMESRSAPPDVALPVPEGHNYVVRDITTKQDSCHSSHVADHKIKTEDVDDMLASIHACHICDFSTHLKVLLKYHILRMHTETFSCKRCPVVLTKHALIQHSKDVHSKEVDLVEVKCEPNGDRPEFSESKGYNPKRIVINPKTRGVTAKVLTVGSKYVCSICPYTTSWKPGVFDHIEKIHVRKYHCKHCSEVMPKFDLVEHSKVLHGKSIKIKDPTLREATADRKSTKFDADDSDFNYDIEDNDDGGFDDDQIQPNAISTVSHDPAYLSCGGSGTKPYACSICEFSSQVEWSLTCHVKALHTLKYYCNHCTAVLTRYEMIKHSKEEHGVEIRLRGPCGLKEANQDVESTADVVDGVHFGGHFMLNPGKTDMDVDDSQNLSAVPEATNHLTCDACGYSANTNVALNSHIDRFHNKRYHCPHCTEILSKHDLMEHAWSMHGVIIKSKNRFLKEADQESDVEVTHDDNQEAFVSTDSSFKQVCTVCGQVFLHRWVMKQHVERMHTAKVECEYCQVIMTKYDMVRHYSTEHDKDVNKRGYKFKKVEGVVDKQEPIRSNAGPSKSEESIRKTSSLKSCSYCEYSSSVVINVDAHIEAMHMIEYHCSHCSVIMSKYDLIRHCESAHGVTTTDARKYRFIKAAHAYQIGEVQSDRDQSETNAKNVCSYCEYSNRVASKVRKHEMTMHTTKFSCQFCSVVMTKYDLLRHSKDVHDVTFVYNSRGFVRADIEAMDDSLANEIYDAGDDSSVGNELPLQCCRICNFSTKTPSSLTAHLQNWHKRKYVCNHCPATMTKHEIIVHSEDVHGVIIHRSGRAMSMLKLAEEGNHDADDDPGTIRPNGTEYTDKNDLTGEPYKCNICNFVSLYKKSMLLHVISFHRKKYHCNDCSSVMTKHDLIVHYKDMHGVDIPSNGRGFKWRQVCDEGFEPNGNDSDSDIYDLLTPQIEMTERNADRSEIKCSVCDFSTLYPYNLKLHFETFHKKLFCCDACPAIMNKHELIQHCQNEHGSKKSRFKEYNEEMAAPDNDETEFINAVMARPRSTLKAGINEDSKENTRDEQNEGIFSCSVCDFTTKHKSSLLDHSQLLHGKKYGCNYCSVIMTKYELICHCKDVHDITIKHSGKGYTFREISDGEDRVSTIEGTPSKSEFDDQGILLTIVGSDGTDFLCSACGYSSAYKSRVQTHITAFHKKQYKCVSCSFTGCKYELIQHCDEVHGIVIPNLGRGWAAKKWFQEVSPDTETTHDESRLEEVSQPQVDGDVGIIREDDGFKCSRCDFHSLYKGNAQTHYKHLHMQKYSCNRCSVILTKYDMIQHYETDHDLVVNKAGKGRVGDYYKEIVEGSEDDDMVASPVENPTSTSETPVEPVMLENGSYACSICSYSSQSRTTVLKHSVLMHIKKYSCNMCSILLNKCDMIKHGETAHGIVVKVKASRQQLFSEVKESEFDEEESDAVNKESEVEEEESATVINESMVEEKKSVACIKKGEQFMCTICSHVSSRMSNMKVHYESRHQKKYSCCRCSAVMPKFDMLQHYGTAHNVNLLNQDKCNNMHYFKPVDDDAGAACSPVASGLDRSAPAEESSTVGTLLKDGGLYKCSVCDYCSGNSYNVAQHLHVLHEKKYACQQCSVVTSKFDMISHYRNDHGIEISKTGSKRQWFKEVDKNADHSAHTGESNLEEEGNESVANLKCPVCDFSTKYSFSIDVHMENWHLKMFSCDICSVVLNKYDLISHCKEVHGVTVNRMGRGLKEAKSALENPDTAEVVPNKGESTMFDCALCDYKSQLRINLHMHMKNVHCQVVERPAVASNAQVQSTEGSDPEDYTDMSDAQAMEARSTFECGICGFTTRHRWYLKDHAIKFHKKKFCCTQCPAVFTKYVLIKHFKSAHGVGNPGRNFPEAEPNAPETSQATELVNDRNTDCIICGQTFKNKYSLQCHVKYLHENKYKCDHCPAVLTKYDLVEHSKTEHGHDLSVKSNKIQPADEVDPSRVQCSYCEFSTLHKWYLGEHVESFHKKMYNCGRCPQAMTKYELLEHSKVKHGVTLSKIGKLKQSAVASPDKNQANPKFGVLSQKRPLACTICPFTSVHSFGLKRHIHINHTVKHSCQQCSAVMTRHDLIKHCRTVHKTKIPDERGDDHAEAGTSNDHTYSSIQTPTQIENPKFQNGIMTILQSPAYQPVILLDRLPIDDDTEVFTVVDNTNATASPLVENPKFHNPTYQSSDFNTNPLIQGRKN